MRRLTALAAFLFVISSAVGQTVWDDFDPEKLPLDVKIIRTQTEGDVEIQVLRYTSEIWNDKPIRVLGMYGRPKGKGKFPAVLHFHGGGQTASPRDVAELVKRGYACFSFDWTGPRKGRTEVTEWPKDIKTHYEPDKTNKLYHAVIAGRRGITFLTRQPEVDAGRIGEYGISWGGYCTWLLNGTDTRLKACVPVYGCGGVIAEGRNQNVYRKRLGSKLEDWMKNFEPLRYGPRQHAPVLYINGSNDFFGWIPTARKLLLSCKVPTRQVFTPGINHGVGPEAAAAAYAWLAHYLKGGPPLPESPALKPAIGPRGIPQAVLTVDRENEAEYVRVDYSLGGALSPGRCWREVPASKAGGLLIAALPVLDPLQEVQAIAQVKYKKGYRLSSVPVIFTPKDLGITVATLKPTKKISIFTDGKGGWSPVFHSTQLYGARQRIELDKEGFEGKPCLKVVPLIKPFTHFTVTFWRPGDPQWNGGDSEALSLWIKGGEKAIWLVATERRKQMGEKNYRYLAKLKPQKGWQRVIARRDQFKFTPRRPRKNQKVSDKTLTSWRDVQVIQINGPVAEGETVMIGPTVWLPKAP
ncbi:MAG: hypothetical protein GXP25_25260 [Planctomycetes bacterium]|nr:hypothetical protein [Planctomycetota bacterium]